MRMTAISLAAAAAISAALRCGCNGTDVPGGGTHLGIGNMYVGPTERARLFAQVVDSLNLPADAGQLEPGPYSYLLGSVLGQREGALRKQTGEEITYQGLMTRPERWRGHVMTAYGMVLEMASDAPPPGLSVRGHRMWKGLLGTLEGEVYAFRTVAPRTARIPRLGQMVWYTGYFFKRYAFRGSDGQIHFAPLLVGPAPSLTEKSFPIWAVARKLGLDKFLPSNPCSSRSVDNRLVIEVALDGSITIDGAEAGEPELHGRLDAEARRAYKAPGTRDWGVVLWYEKGTRREMIEALESAVRSHRVLYPVLEVRQD